MGELAAFLAAKGQNRPGVMLYFDFFDLLKEYSAQEIGEIVLSLRRFAQYGEVPTFSDRGMRVIWREMERRAVADGDNWEKKAAQTLYATYSRQYKKRYGEEVNVPSMEAWLDMERKEIAEKTIISGNDMITARDGSLTARDGSLTARDGSLTARDQQQNQHQNTEHNNNSKKQLQQSDADAEGKSRGNARGEGKGSKTR